LCTRVFVANVPKLGSDHSVWGKMQKLLRLLPEHLVPKLFTMLREACPQLLSQAMITAVRHYFIIDTGADTSNLQYFLKGTSITLTDNLPAVNRNVILAITCSGQNLRELNLSGFEKYSDDLFASLFSSLPSLRVLVLR